MKKWISLLLVCCMLLSVLPMTAAARDLPFSDVQESDWFYSSVKQVYDDGLMVGTADNTFAPHITLNRAMLVTILYRAEGSPAVTTTPSFKDVKAGTWYTDAIAWAEENRIVAGYDGETFGPDDPITREQMVTILYRYTDYAGKDTSDRAALTNFSDGEATSNWALSGMQWAVAMEIIYGKGAGRLDPQGTATRAEVAAVVARFCENIGTANFYTVTFLRNDGSDAAVQAAAVAPGACVSQPQDPTRLDATFTGWYTEAEAETLYDFSQPVRRNLKLYAGWDVQEPEESEGVHGYSYGGETIYSVTGIQMDGSVVTVTLNANSASTLRVEFLDEQTQEVLATASTQTPEYCELTPVSILVESELPEYYIVRAGLYDVSGQALCNPLTSIEYTSSYAEFAALTVDDFDGQNVLNFDNDKTNNFGVLSGDIVEVVTTTTTNSLTVTIAEGFPSAYTFAQPDQTVRGLQAGDKVLVTGENEQPYLFMVAAAEAGEDGAITLTPQQDVSMTDFYDVLKVNMDVDTAEVEPDRQTKIEIIDVDDKTWSESISGTLSATIGPLTVSGGLTGIGTVTVKMLYNAKLWSEDYFCCSIIAKVELKADATVDVSMDNSETIAHEFELAKIAVNTGIPGLDVYLAPTVPTEWSISAKANLLLTASTTSGFTYDTISGMQVVDMKERDAHAMMGGKATVSIGPKVGVGVSFLGDVAKADVSVQAGVEATASISADVSLTEDSTQLQETDAPSLHGCLLCLEGDLDWFVKANAKFSYCIIKGKLEDTPFNKEILRVSGPVVLSPELPGKFYISLVNYEDSMFGGKLHFDGGECPNYAWRTTVEAVSEGGKEVAAQVTIWSKDGAMQGTGPAPYTTYLYNGEYTATAIAGEDTVTTDFTVAGEAQTVTLTFVTPEDEIYTGALEAYKEACDFYARWVLAGGRGPWGDYVETYEQGIIPLSEVEGDIHIRTAATDITTLQQLKDALAQRFSQELVDDCLGFIDPIEKDGKLYTLYFPWGSALGPIDTIESMEKAEDGTYIIRVGSLNTEVDKWHGKVGFTYTNGQYHFFTFDEKESLDNIVNPVFVFWLSSSSDITLP